VRSRDRAGYRTTRLSPQDPQQFNMQTVMACAAVLVGDARTTVGKIDGIGAARDMPIATTTLPIKARTPVEGLDPSSDS
jgi:hypothetical protein